jgi:hypothetical protein
MFRPCVLRTSSEVFFKTPLSNSLHLSTEHVNLQCASSLSKVKRYYCNRRSLKASLKVQLRYKSLWAWRRLGPRVLWHGID